MLFLQINLINLENDEGCHIEIQRCDDLKITLSRVQTSVITDS